jgi:hypothetical protein
MSYWCKTCPNFCIQRKQKRQREEWMNEWIHPFIHSFIWSDVLRNVHQVLLFWVGSSSFCEHGLRKMPLERRVPKVSAFQLCLGWVLHLGMSHCFLSVTLHIIPLMLKFAFCKTILPMFVKVNFHYFLFFIFLTLKLQFQHI